MDPRGRIAGSLLGLALGDCVGAACEFKSPNTFEPLTDLVDSHVHGIFAGQFTDDTSLALCLAESLIERRVHDPVDQSRLYYLWWKTGRLSSTGECFDIGNATRQALQRFHQTGEKEPYCGPTGNNSAGNGSLMRLCPVPLLLHRFPALAIAISGDSSRTTHQAAAAVDACRYFGGLLVGALQGATKEQLLAPGFVPTGVPADNWSNPPLHPEVAEVALGGSYLQREPRPAPAFRSKAARSEASCGGGSNEPIICNSGYVVRSLEAALWAFKSSNTFEEGCLLVANLGEDSDTVAAIYGQLAGAFYGLNGLPAPWLDRLFFKDLIASMAEEIAAMADHVTPDVAGSGGGGDAAVPSFHIGPDYSRSSAYDAVSNMYHSLEDKLRRETKGEGSELLLAEALADGSSAGAANILLQARLAGTVKDFERRLQPFH